MEQQQQVISKVEPQAREVRETAQSVIATISASVEKSSTPKTLSEKEIKVLETNYPNLNDKSRKEAIISGNIVFLPPALGLVRATNVESWKENNIALFDEINSKISIFNKKAKDTYVVCSRSADLEKVVNDIQKSVTLLQKVQGVDSDVISECRSRLISCLQIVNNPSGKPLEVPHISTDRHLSRDFSTKPQKVNEVIQQYSSLDEYYSKIIKPIIQSGGKEINLPEALIAYASFAAKRRGEKNFDGDAVMAKLQDAANQVAKELSSKFPEHQGMSKEDVQQMSAAKVEKIITTVSQVILGEKYTYDSPKLNRTIEQVLNDKKGNCEDLTNLYLCVVQLLKTNGYELPIYPQLQPAHIAMLWDDGKSHKYAVESTLGGEINNERSLVLIKGQEFKIDNMNSPLVKKYLDTNNFVALPNYYGLGSEIVNHLYDAPVDQAESIRKGKIIAEIEKGAQNFGTLASLHLRYGNYNSANEAANQAISIDPSKPNFHLLKAKAELGEFYDKLYQGHDSKKLESSLLAVLKSLNSTFEITRDNLDAKDILANMYVVNSELARLTNNVRYEKASSENLRTIDDYYNSEQLLNVNNVRPNHYFRVASDPNLKIDAGYFVRDRKLNFYVDVNGERELLVSDISKAENYIKSEGVKQISGQEVTSLLIQANRQLYGDFHDRALITLHVLAKRLLLDNGLQKNNVELSACKRHNPKLIELLDLIIKEHST
ncbi:MAG: hypothetical protein KBC84_09340 [Proteobacteria bacterium]|nr:hypothetical protein [Pseudomonadota bacterium]